MAKIPNPNRQCWIGPVGWAGPTQQIPFNDVPLLNLSQWQVYECDPELIDDPNPPPPPPSPPPLPTPPPPPPAPTPPPTPPSQPDPCTRLAPGECDRDATTGRGGECCNLPAPPETPCDFCKGSNSGDCPACCLREETAEIGKQLEYINETLKEKLGGTCDNVDKCIDEIIDKISKKLNTGAKSCASCRQDIENGLAGTLEFAIQCSHCAIDACNAECSIGKGNEGACCNTCGKSPCCCQQGECVPCGEGSDKKERYVGWCNPDTGVVVVLPHGARPPGAGWIDSPAQKTEEVAFLEAQRYCDLRRNFPEPTTPTEPNFPRPVDYGSCDILYFDSDEAAQTFLADKKVDEAAVAMQLIVNNALQELVRASPATNKADVIARGFVDLATSGPVTAAAMSQGIAGLLGCDNSSLGAGLSILSLLGVAGKSVSTDLTQFARPIIYAINSLCNTGQLDPDKAIAAWLAGSVTDRQLATHWKIAGYCNEALERYKIAAKSKPVPLQLSLMRRRKMISDSEYDQGMRRLGYLDRSETENLHTLTESIPTLSDIIRLMVRDADDETIAQSFGTDSQFDQKFGGQLKEWAEWQGIPEKFVKYAWRAHWSIPSPTQLYEMYHRLRFDPKFGGPDNFLKDVKSALVQQDILPFWIDKLLAVSFRPLARVDVRRAYDIGALDEKAVEKSYLDLGYSDDNAKVLKDFTIRLRNEKATADKAIKLWLKWRIDGDECFARMQKRRYPDDVIQQAMRDAEIGFLASPQSKQFLNGELSQELLAQDFIIHGLTRDGINRIISVLGRSVRSHPVLEEYIVGLADRQIAEAEMQVYGVHQNRITRLLDKADLAFKAKTISACVNGIKDRFVLGELTADQAIDALANRGIIIGRARQFVDAWNCERDASGRDVPVNTLCGWLDRGAIGPGKFVDRLKGMGYDDDDAINLLTDCTSKLNAKQQREATELAKRNAAALEKQRSAERKRQAELEREQAKIQKARKQAAATMERRQRQSLSAAGKYAKKCECELWDATREIRDQSNRLQREYGLSIDESLRAILQGIEAWSGPAESDVSDPIDSFAAFLAAGSAS